MKIIEKIRSWFKKVEEYYPIPEEYMFVVFTKEAENGNLKEDINKEIRIYKDNILIKIFPYSKTLLESLNKELEIPYWDFTTEDKELPIRDITTPGEEIKYEVIE